MTRHWVVQGNPLRWDDADRLYTDPITRWCVTGIQRDVEVGDGVLVWLANRDPERRGVHAVGRATSPPTSDGGKPYVELDVDRYVTHDPVSVVELRESAFATHGILRMARRTAYPCTPAEFDAACALVDAHGATPVPTRPR